MANGTCRSCGAPVIWSRNVKSRIRNPIDPEPTENGNVVFGPDEPDGYKQHMVLTKAQLAEPASGPRHTSHFATCPNANQHRKGVS